ncbi:MAG TPA: ABC transporter ATP-binding protein [Acetobacteraceae bacterium]|jgi:peptide/nickel transport system ATP-binding protein|nr:ABC transporter ATP-binding protein [Acetobacteraceae bacterium]
MAELLSVRDLSVSFVTEGGTARVLDAVNLSLAQGEIMGLVGESGCGKTTLARSILGALPANANVRGGTLMFDGRDLLAMDPATVAAHVRGRAITFVPQDPYSSFSPLFTIGDQVMELLRWKSPDRRGWSRARRRADRERALALLRTVQLPDPERLLHKYPHELSGGQRQRVMIAMALLPEPKLVIADEPTTALDVTIQAQILKLLRRLATERGVSVLFATHDLGTAWEICDRVTVMYAGQELETAPIADFFRAPMVPYTRLLLESLPSSGSALRGIPGDVPSLVSPPPGCRFHPRCPQATDVCRQDHPMAREPDAGHQVRCHHPQLQPVTA